MSAMYYLNRGGAPEGPFEEARLVHMIQSGELTQGGVCPVGQQQWLPLQAVPAFAQALTARSALQNYGAPPGQAPQAYGPPQGYGPPGAQPVAPTQPGYGAQPQQAPGYGVQPAPAQGYGQPPGYGAAPAQPGYGAAPAQAPSAAGTPPAKKSNRTLLFAALGAFFLLFIVGAAGATYLMFFASGGARSIAKTIPRDGEFLIEVPSVHKLASDLHDVQFLDTSLRDDKQVFDTASNSVTKAFDISQSEALALLASAETFGISGRKLATSATSSPELALVIGMKNSSPVEALLKTPRFVSVGSVGKTGKRYELTRKTPLPPGAEQDAVLKGLSEAEIGAVGPAQMVWFPKDKVLAIGSESLLIDIGQVLEANAAAIDQSPAYDAAHKDFDSSARLTMFVDPNVFSAITDPKVKTLVDDYFKPAGPITGSLQVKPVGFLTRFTGRITGNKLPRATAYEAPQALNLGEKLPEETFAYMAASTRTKLSGADMQKLLLDQAGSVDPRSRVQIEQGLRQIETVLGVSAAKLVDGAGGQSVLALSAVPGVSLDALGVGPQAASYFNLTWVLELKDATEYQKLAAQLKTKLLPGVREVTMVDNGTGFTLTPRGVPLPVSLRVKFLDKYLFVTAGSNTLGDRAEAAFSKGERTLKDDAAHKSALAALPDTQHFLMWFDAGRIGDTLQKSPQVKAEMTQNGLSLDKIKLTGPDRVVSALSVRSEVANEVWTYQMDALNFQALAPLGAGGAVLGGGLGHLPGL